MSMNNVMGPLPDRRMPQGRNLNKPLLSITTIYPDRPYIEVDDEAHFLRMPSELSVLERTQLEQMIQRVQAIDFEGDDDTSSYRLLDRLLNNCVLMLVPSLEPVKVQLISAENKTAILEAFTGSLSSMTSPTTAMPELVAERPSSPSAKPTGANSSRSSNRSTRRTTRSDG